jgi:hypothetical protein
MAGLLLLSTILTPAATSGRTEMMRDTPRMIEQKRDGRDPYRGTVSGRPGFTEWITAHYGFSEFGYMAKRAKLLRQKSMRSFWSLGAAEVMQAYGPG